MIPAYSKIDAKGGGDGPPPSFETDSPADVLPAQIAALVTTRHGLEDIKAEGEDGPTDAGIDADTYIANRFAIAWDGKTPKHKDMAVDPVPIFSTTDVETHTALYIGLAFNQRSAAGFKGARAALHLQIDTDEEPNEDDQVQAGAPPLSVINAFPGGETIVTYDYYRPSDDPSRPAAWVPLPILDDDTDSWTRSGFIRFDVPTNIGPISDGAWVEVETDLPHPLVGALKTPVPDTPSDVPISGWIRVNFTVAPKIAIRSLNFNNAPASNLTTIERERLGRGSRHPGQTMQLGNGNVAAETLDLVSRDDTLGDTLISWTPVLDFDAAGPNDRVYVLDPEAGLVIFGDGNRGYPPQPSELMIAMLYRHGGGESGEVGTGQISQPAGLPVAISAAVNVIPARGGARRRDR